MFITRIILLIIFIILLYISNYKKIQILSEFLAKKRLDKHYLNIVKNGSNEEKYELIKKDIDEYKDIIRLIGDKFNYPFDVNIGNCIFDFKEKDINLSINKCTNGFETNYYNIKTDKNNTEIIKEDNSPKLIYSCNKKNIVGTDIEIRKADKNEFSKYLFTLLNRMNQKYNFMEFDYKDYNDFTNKAEIMNEQKEQNKNELEI